MAENQTDSDEQREYMAYTPRRITRSAKSLVNINLDEKVNVSVLPISERKKTRSTKKEPAVNLVPVEKKTPRKLLSEVKVNSPTNVSTPAEAKSKKKATSSKKSKITESKTPKTEERRGRSTARYLTDKIIESDISNNDLHEKTVSKSIRKIDIEKENDNQIDEHVNTERLSTSAESSEENVNKKTRRNKRKQKLKNSKKSHTNLKDVEILKNSQEFDDIISDEVTQLIEANEELISKENEELDEEKLIEHAMENIDMDNVSNIEITTEQNEISSPTKPYNDNKSALQNKSSLNEKRISCTVIEAVDENDKFHENSEDLKNDVEDIEINKENEEIITNLSDSKDIEIINPEPEMEEMNKVEVVLDETFDCQKDDELETRDNSEIKLQERSNKQDQNKEEENKVIEQERMEKEDEGNGFIQEPAQNNLSQQEKNILKESSIITIDDSVEIDKNLSIVPDSETEEKPPITDDFDDKSSIIKDIEEEGDEDIICIPDTPAAPKLSSPESNQTLNETFDVEDDIENIDPPSSPPCFKADSVAIEYSPKIEMTTSSATSTPIANLKTPTKLKRSTTPSRQIYRKTPIVKEIKRDYSEIELEKLEAKATMFLKQSHLDRAKIATPLRSIRKRSFSVADVDMSKKNFRVTFHSPANEETTIDNIDESMRTHLEIKKEENSQKKKKNLEVKKPMKRRKRSFSNIETDTDKKSTLAEMAVIAENEESSTSTTPNKRAKVMDTLQTRVKMPNFHAIHKQYFNKMESIVDHQVRKTERAKILTNSSTKLVRSEVKPVDKGKSDPSKIPKILQFEHITKPTARVEPSSSTKKEESVSKPIQVIDKAKNVVSEVNKVEERRKKNMALYKGKSGAKSSKEETATKRAALLKGVRLNRRFELQMEYRKHHD